MKVNIHKYTGKCKAQDLTGSGPLSDILAAGVALDKTATLTGPKAPAVK